MNPASVGFANVGPGETEQTCQKGLTQGDGLGI